MKIAVTGAGGGLGSAFIAAAKEAGHECLPFTRKEADLENPLEAASALTSAKPEVILHAAAMTAVDQCEAEPDKARSINVDGTRAVASAAVECGAKLIYISTDYVFNGHKAGAYTEEDETDPLNVYGKTKLAGEGEALQAEGALVVRTSWLYGAKGKSFVKTVLSMAEGGGILRMVDDQQGAPTYTGHFAAAILRLMDVNASGIVNACAAGFCTWHDFALAVFAEKGVKVGVEAITSEQLGRPAKRPHNSRLDCSRYERLTGDTIPHWKDGLRECLNG